MILYKNKTSYPIISVSFTAVIRVTMSFYSIPAVSLPFPGGDRASERKIGRAKEHAWGEQKNWGEVGRGFVIFRPAQRKLNYHPKIMIFDDDQNKNVALECKESVRYLGVIIDNNLSWKQHIDHVAIKISRTVGLICKLRHFLPRQTLLTIYRSLVIPYLTYGLTAWGQAYKSYLEKLLKLQQRALRFIYFSELNQHTIPLFIDAGVFTVKIFVLWAFS